MTVGTNPTGLVADTVCGVFADHLTACNLDCCLSVCLFVCLSVCMTS